MPCRPRRLAVPPFAALASLLILLLAPAAPSRAGIDHARFVDLQLLHLSGWLGQIDPVPVSGVGTVGGAAALSAYWKADRARRPATLAVCSGGSFGASQPLAGLFDDVPAILAMNLMGVDADTLGNHNFNHGLATLQRLIDLARFPFVSANLRNLESNLQGVRAFRIFRVQGVRVAVIGITNPDAPVVTRPGAMGTLQVTGAARAANAARRRAQAAGATVFVALVHLGVQGTTTAAVSRKGPLIDFAERVQGFDAIFGDGADEAVQARVRGALVVQDRLRGLTYSRTLLRVDTGARRVVRRSAEFVTPRVDAVTPDPSIDAVLAPYRSQLAERFDAPAGVATALFPYSDGAGWTSELESGNLVADALRAEYGTDFAVANGGGLRDGLPSRYTPANTALRRPAPGYAPGPPYDLVGGDFYSLLPFNNFGVTREVTGELLHAVLEHGVSLMPAPSGRFLQVSGLRYTFDSSRPVGQRLLSVTRDDGTPIPADGTLYTLALNDFIDAGGDEYTMLADGQGVTREALAETVLQYVRRVGSVTPRLEGRVRDVAGGP